MKLVSYYGTLSAGGVSGLRMGALNTAGTAVLDLEQAARAHQVHRPAAFASMLAFLESWPASVDVVRDLLDKESAQLSDSSWRPRDQIRLAAPLPIPTSIRDCMAFEQHLVQSMRTIVRQRFPVLFWLDRLTRATVGCRVLRPPRVWYERPLYYKGNCRSVVGPEADIHWPSYSHKLDFELELGVVIGKQGRDISPHQAHEFVAGYTLFNDFSARDIQLAELRGYLGPAKSKDFDTGNALGPFLATPDELGDVSKLILSARVNGQEWTSARVGEMRFTFAEIIAYISRDETLYPGDFIASGTLPGGCGLEWNRWLQPGDIVELDGGSLGVLRNRIVKKSRGEKLDDED